MRPLPADRLRVRACTYPARLDGCSAGSDPIPGPWCGECERFIGQCAWTVRLVGTILLSIAPEVWREPGAYTAHPQPISQAHLVFLARALPVVERVMAQAGLDDPHVKRWCQRVREAIRGGRVAVVKTEAVPQMAARRAR